MMADPPKRQRPGDHGRAENGDPALSRPAATEGDDDPVARLSRLFPGDAEFDRLLHTVLSETQPGSIGDRMLARVLETRARRGS